MRKLERTSELLKVQVTLTKTSKSQVFVFDPAGSVLKADTFNLASEKSREAFCNTLSDECAAAVGPLLLDILVELATVTTTKKEDVEVLEEDVPQPTVPEPWPDPVDGEALLDAVCATFHQFIVLPPFGGIATTLWSAHTYTLDVADNSPLLLVISPEKRCGKTTLLSVTESISYKAAPVTSLTTANLYRTLKDGFVTLSLDETDTFLKKNLELIGLLNRGHTKRNAFTIRREKDANGQLKGVWFPLWGAKVVASIGKVWHTLADRSIRIPLRRARKSEIPDRIRPVHDAQFEILSRQLVRWTRDSMEELRSADPLLPDELNSREADNWRPLIALADVAGGEWPHRARAAAVTLRIPESDIESPGMQLLSDLRDVLEDWEYEYIPTETLLDRLFEQDVYWRRYDYGKPLTEKGLADLLSEYFVAPTRRRLKLKGVVAVKGAKKKAPRGYLIVQLQQAFETYLPPDDPEQPEHVGHDGDPPEPGVPGAPGTTDTQENSDDMPGSDQ